MKALISSALFLLVASTAYAETFEISGAVQRIELEKSLMDIVTGKQIGRAHV